MGNVLELEKEMGRMGKPKRISVSSKRQITIPKEFYENLNISEEVLCEVVDGALIIKPVQEVVDFSEFILRDLVNEGYQGEELLHEFTHRKSQIRPALSQMIAENRDHIVYSNTEDYFNHLLDEEEDE